MEINYQFGVGEKVTTVFGKVGFVKMAGTDDGGLKYYVRTEDGSDWYNENELSPMGHDINVLNNQETYLTEDKEEEIEQED